MPIYNTASYVFDSCENAAKRFSLEEDGPIYTRLNNPTITALEERMASLEGGSCAVAFASGMAAITATVLNLASAGDHIVSSPRLYGGTLTLFEFTLARLGIEVTFVDDPDDPQSWHDAVRPNTKLFFAESTANPLADILDVPAVAAVAHEAKVPFVVDNTVPTAALIRPLELGADVVVASLTKFYTGNSTGIGGIAIDGGTFDWTVTRDGQPIFPGFANPDPTYHGIVYADLGEMAFGVKLRVGVLRDIGGCLSPFNAWVTLAGPRHLGAADTASLLECPQGGAAPRRSAAGDESQLSGSSVLAVVPGQGEARPRRGRRSVVVRHQGWTQGGLGLH